MDTPICLLCEGTGTYGGGMCPTCKGTGKAVGIMEQIQGYGKVTFEKQPTATKLIYTFKIVEIIDDAEYAALVDPAKDGWRIILSCGVVDLVHTGKIYLDLMAIFGSSPITKAAIEAL